MLLAMTLAERIGVWQQRLYLQLAPALRRAEVRRALRHGKRPQPPHLATGMEGEAHAYLYLVRLGYTVLARRWTSERVRGDLDLVAFDGETLVVFEVKTRTARDEYLAEEQVGEAKRGQLRRLTRLLLAEMASRESGPPPVRFDVLSVYLEHGGVDIEHRPNVFSLKPGSAL